jgi:hypothetical protein
VSGQTRFLISVHPESKENTRALFLLDASVLPYKELATPKFSAVSRR